MSVPKINVGFQIISAVAIPGGKLSVQFSDSSGNNVLFVDNLCIDFPKNPSVCRNISLPTSVSQFVLCGVACSNVSSGVLTVDFDQLMSGNRIVTTVTSITRTSPTMCMLNADATISTSEGLCPETTECSSKKPQCPALCSPQTFAQCPPLNQQVQASPFCICLTKDCFPDQRKQICVCRRKHSCCRCVKKQYW
jgi:hypothetical protein